MKKYVKTIFVNNFMIYNFCPQYFIIKLTVSLKNAKNPFCDLWPWIKMYAIMGSMMGTFYNFIIMVSKISKFQLSENECSWLWHSGSSIRLSAQGLRVQVPAWVAFLYFIFINWRHLCDQNWTTVAIYVIYFFSLLFYRSLSMSPQTVKG